MKVIAACVFVSLGLAPTMASAQQHSGSLEDQLACTPDVYRLCSSYIPDEDNIVACLQRNISKLSNACHEVFSRPENTAPPKRADPGTGDDN